MKKSDINKFADAYEYYGPKIVKWFVIACFVYAGLMLGSLVLLLLIA